VRFTEYSQSRDLEGIQSMNTLNTYRRRPWVSLSVASSNR